MKKIYDNRMEITFDSKSENEGLARVVAAAFCAKLDPTIEEISDIKTAVSEAVTNCVVHGYDGGDGIIRMRCYLKQDKFIVEIHDD